MTLMRLLTLNTYHFQICDLGKGRVAEVIIASGPFYVDHDPSLSEACRGMVDGQNGHLQGSLFGENLQDGGI